MRTRNSKNCGVYAWFLRSRKSPKLGEADFYSPFFVFGEHVSLITISKITLSSRLCRVTFIKLAQVKYEYSEKCKQLNMVTPVQLLLFGCRKIEWVQEERIIKMDSWFVNNLCTGIFGEHLASLY